MSPEAILAAERQRREAAESEVLHLRAQLAALTQETTASRQLVPDTLNMARVISQLKQAEQQLEDQQSLVRQVIDNSPNLVYVEDETGQRILTNQTYTNLLAQQVSPSEATCPPTSRPPFTVPDVPMSFEECFHLRDGRTVWYYTTKSLLVRTDGSRYVLTFSSDITDLKEAHRVAEESVRAKQVFMANMSHEIRTPLHGVMGLSELLKKGPLSAEQTDYVDMIQSSTANLLVVINDILDFTKMEAGAIRLESIPFDILKTVQEAVRSLAFKSDEKGLLLRIEYLGDELPLAQGDPFRLHQVLVNLISNAIKFTHRGAIIVTIDARQREGSVLPVTFSVADTGIGISADNLEHVFSSFRQADSSIPRLYGGTGLGLTICKNLVELQGGQMSVRSELGQGSTFIFSLPYTVSEGQLVKEPTAVQQPDLLQGLSVLLAEDNGVNQLIAVSMLGQWQVQVDIAQNGVEALNKAQHQAYDLILMDIQMPQIDGIEATARLRAVPGPNQHTPVVALTADAIQVNAESATAQGFSNFLIKPYSEVALYKMLAQVSKRAHALPQELDLPAPVPTNLRKLHYDFLMLGKLATDTEFIRQMLELFVSRVPNQVQTLYEAIEHKDWRAAAREAHSLKTTFGSLNIQPETEYLKKIERLAEAAAPQQEFRPLISSVRKATQRFSDIFTEELEQLAQISQAAP